MDQTLEAPNGADLISSAGNVALDVDRHFEGTTQLVNCQIAGFAVEPVGVSAKSVLVWLNKLNVGRLDCERVAWMSAALGYVGTTSRSALQVDRSTKAAAIMVDALMATMAASTGSHESRMRY